MSEKSEDDRGGSGPGPDRFDAWRATLGLTPLHRLLGIVILGTEDDGVVVGEMPVREEAFNRSGNLHGGAIATLCDVAAGSAAARTDGFRPGENTLVTADLHVRYLGRPKGDVIHARAQVIRAGRQLIVVEVRVVDLHGNLIAVADFSAMIVALRQPLEGHAALDANAPDL